MRIWWWRPNLHSSSKTGTLLKSFSEGWRIFFYKKIWAVETWNIRDPLKRVFPKFEAEWSHPRWVNGRSKFRFFSMSKNEMLAIVRNGFWQSFTTLRKKKRNFNHKIEVARPGSTKKLTTVLSGYHLTPSRDNSFFFDGRWGKAADSMHQRVEMSCQAGHKT